MHLSSHCQIVQFDRFPLIQYFLPSAVIHIGRRQIIRRFMVALVFVVSDEALQMFQKLLQRRRSFTSRELLGSVDSVEKLANLDA